jgi:pyrroloquinoline quinone (PQQ) biosynthesis protein C
VTPPSNSQLLRTKIRLAEPCLLEVTDRFWTHPRLAQIFPEFLYMMHSIIRSSVSLINAAAESAERRANSDASCRVLAKYYRTHAREETHHDDWLLDDTVAIGADRNEILSRLPSPAVAELVGAQYYWALHIHPVALLGYLAILEGNPSSVKELDGIRKKHGLPAAGFRTMIKHAKLDPHHRDEIYAVLDQLVLTEKLAELVALSAFHTIDHIGQAVQEILDAFDERRFLGRKLARAV